MTNETVTASDPAADASAKTAATDLSNYGWMTSTFYVTARNLSVKRVWAIDDFDREKGPELRLLIQGHAGVQGGDVRVIGGQETYTEFDLNIHSSENAKAEHEWVKAHELTDDRPDAPERRKLIREALDASPPTAVLSVGNWEGSGWHYIECKIPTPLLQRIEAEVLAGRIDQLSIGIKWVGGLTNKWELGNTLWLEKPPPDHYRPDPLPDPLQGHITHVSWVPATERTRTDAAAEVVAAAKVDQHLRKWLAKAEPERLKDEKGRKVRYANAAIDAAKAVAAWFKQHNDPSDPDRIAYHLDYQLEDAVRFVQQLDEALHPDKSVFADDTSKVWFHRDFGRFYRFASKPTQREAAIERMRLAALVNEYLDHPEFHTPYLDWVLVDALTFAEIISTAEDFAIRKFGWSYELADGSQLKLYVYKALGWVIWLISVAIGWGWPAAVVYLAKGDLSPWAIGGLAAYYALLLCGLLVSVGRKMRSLFLRQPTPAKKLETSITEMEKAYHALSTGSAIQRARRAFDKSFEVGVLWNPQIFSLLDMAERR